MKVDRAGPEEFDEVSLLGGWGGIVALPARLGDRHARPPGLGSQRERGWPATTPPKEGGGMGS